MMTNHREWWRLSDMLFEMQSQIPQPMFFVDSIAQEQIDLLKKSLKDAHEAAWSLAKLASADEEETYNAYMGHNV